MFVLLIHFFEVHLLVKLLQCKCPTLKMDFDKIKKHIHLYFIARQYL